MQRIRKMFALKRYNRCVYMSVCVLESDTVVYICYRTATVMHICYHYRTATVALVPLPYRYHRINIVTVPLPRLDGISKMEYTTVTVRKSIGNWDHRLWDHTAESAVTCHRNFACS